MDLKIKYSKRALKFFKKNSSVLTEENSDKLVTDAARKIILREEINLNLKPMKGKYLGFYRIRFRNIRIIFSLNTKGEIVLASIDNIDFRGNIYKS